MSLTRAVSDFKDSVRAATTGANINLAAAPNTLDGVSLVLNDRVLVKDQTPSSLNGIYRVTTLGTGSNGVWTRASDFNDYRQITSGALTFVQQGTISGNIFYYIPGGEPNVQIGTTAITFSNLYSFIDNTVSQNLQSVTSYGNTTTYGITISNTTTATSTTTGALIVSGGVGIGGNLYVSGNLSVAGNTTFINTTTITTSDTIAAPAINAGTIGNSGSNLVGLVNTNSQPYVTSVGTLTGLVSSGNISAQTANVYASNLIGNTAVYSSAYYWSNGATFAQTVTGTYSNSNVAAYLPTYTGTLSPNSLTTSNGGQITGYLNGAIGANVANTGAFTTISATSTIVAQGTISSPTINAGTIGNSGALLYGTLNSSSASQPNITSVGTLTSLTSSGTIAAPTVIGAIIGNSGAQFYGTLNSQSSNQPNISSVGTLTSLTTSGNITAQTANVYAANLIGNTAIYGAAFYFANGTPFSSSSYGNTQVGYYLNSNLITSTISLPGNVIANAIYANSYLYANGNAFSSGSSGVTLTTSNTAPSSPTAGAQWYQGNTDILYEYIKDATGASYWVDISTRAVVSNGASAGAFTTISATSTIVAQGTISSPTINAGTIGNSGALLYGTLNSSSASQPNITSVGTLTSLTTSGNITATSGTMVMASSFLRNRIINGGMQVAQYGTSVTPTNANFTYAMDRFFCALNAGTSGFTVTQLSQAATGLAGFYNALRYQRNSGQTSTTTMAVGQTIETANCYDLAGQTVTLSFYARAGSNFSAASSQITARIATGTGVDQGSNGAYNGSWTGYAQTNNTITLTTSWQRFSVTASVGSSVNEIQILFYWAGTGTAGANDYVDITGVQLEVGSVATPFERRQYGEELLLCQRYFYKMGAGSVYANFGMGRAYSTTNGQTSFSLPVSMRAAPTGSYSALTDFNAAQTSGNITAFIIPSAYSTDYRQMMVDITATFSSAQTIALNANNTTNAYMTFSAEL